ncbi:MAG: FIST signal transduction protein [Lautropia sp.]
MKLIGTYTHRQGRWQGDGDAVPPLGPDTDHERTLALVFGAAEQLDDPAPIAELRALLPRAKLVGASGAGAVSSMDVLDASATLALVRFEHTDMAVVGEEVAAVDDSRAAGIAIARRLVAREGLSAVYVLADGLLVNGPELVQGLNEILPRGVSLAGGMAGDTVAFQRTWTIVDGVPRQRHVTAVGFYGTRLQMQRGCRGGSVGFGPRRMVTRSAGNVVYELDGAPALQLYKDFLGEHASSLPGGASHFPLSVFRTPQSEAVIRFVLGIDEAAQSITVAGDIPEGSQVQLSRANRSDLLEGALQAASEATAGLESGPVLNLVVSCIGRRIVLGEQTEEELETTVEQLPAGSMQAGFYSYGEISASTDRRCDMHNMTLTMTTLAEA